MKIITVINLVCACVKTSAEDDDDFQGLSKGEREREREGEREREDVCVCLFNLRGFYVLVSHITLFQVSFGVLGINF